MIVVLKYRFQLIENVLVPVLTQESLSFDIQCIELTHTNKYVIAAQMKNDIVSVTNNVINSTSRISGSS